jgi:Leucine-rich repeat (LRR) protein
MKCCFNEKKKRQSKSLKTMILKRNLFLIFKNRIELAAVKLNGGYLKKKLNISNINDQVSLDLSSKDINEIEPNLFHNCQKLEKLSLSRNQLKTLDKNLFANCTSLKKLDFYHNQIDKIEPTLFHKCHKLEKLNLGSNKVKILDKNLFEKCTNLKKIYLDSNNIDEIEPTLFHTCHKLEILDLRSNKVKILDKNLFVNCKNLKKIYLDAKEFHFIKNINNKKIYVCFSNYRIEFDRPDCLILILSLKENASIDLLLHQYKSDVDEFCIIDEKDNILNQFPLVSIFSFV